MPARLPIGIQRLWGDGKIWIKISPSTPRLPGDNSGGWRRMGHKRTPVHKLGSLVKRRIGKGPNFEWWIKVRLDGSKIGYHKGWKRLAVKVLEDAYGSGFVPLRHKVVYINGDTLDCRLKNLRVESHILIQCPKCGKKRKIYRKDLKRQKSTVCVKCYKQTVDYWIYSLVCPICLRERKTTNYEYVKQRRTSLCLKCIHKAKRMFGDNLYEFYPKLITQQRKFYVPLKNENRNLISAWKRENVHLRRGKKGNSVRKEQRVYRRLRESRKDRNRRTK